MSLRLFHEAAFSGSVDKVTALLEDDGVPIDGRDASGATALFHAAARGHADVVQAFIEHGADVNAVDRDQCTPLHNASFCGHVKCVQLLTSAGADVNAVDVDGSTALHKGAFSGHLQVCSTLLASGAHVDATDRDGATPLDKAAFKGHANVIDFLLSKGATAAHQDAFGCTALHRVAFSGHSTLVETLLGAPDAPLDVPDADGHTPLHLAVFNTHSQVVSHLLDAHANVNAVTPGGVTPLHLAAYTGSVDVMRVLFQHSGCDANAIDAEGMTPLHYAAIRAMNGAVNMVLSNGADATLKDSHDRTAADVCEDEAVKVVIERVTASDAEESGVKLNRWGFVGETVETEEERAYKQMEVEREMKWVPLLKKWDYHWKRKQRAVRARVYKGIPDSLRGMAWVLLAGTTKARRGHPGLYAKLLEAASDHEDQIMKDLHRTFPLHVQFKDAAGKTALKHVLMAYSAYDAHLGYNQAMAFVTALLLMYMEEEDAFWTLTKLVDEHQMRGLWIEGMPSLKKCFWMLEKLLTIFLPRIAVHLEEMGVLPVMYCPQYFMTAFTYNLPWPCVLRVWDIFLMEGHAALYATCIAVFKQLEDEILRLNMEDCLRFLKFEHTAHGGDDKVATFSQQRLGECIAEYMGKVKTKVAKFDKEWAKANPEDEELMKRQQQDKGKYDTQQGKK